jgi:hypothetical protein
MSRTIGCIFVLLTASVAAAQERQPGDPFRLTLRPAALPAPAVRYRLLPQGGDLVPGNAAAIYYRAMAAFVENGTLMQQVRSAQWEDWLKMPPGELPLDEVAARLEVIGPILRDFDDAARRRDCDWQLADRPEGITLLIPEVQGLREMARPLGVRARYRIARGQFAEAVEALRTGYALGHHLGRQSPLIHVLVGAAITQIMDNVLEELLQQPGAPNLYWALAVLPRPYFNLEAGLDQQVNMIECTWPGLRQLGEGPMTPEQVRRLRQEISQMIRRYGFIDPGPLDVLAQTARQALVLPQAREALAAYGLLAEQLDAMPPFQVVALYCLRDFHRAWDDYAKWLRAGEFGPSPASEKDRRRLEEASDRLQRLVLYARPLPANQGILGQFLLEKMGRVAGRTDRRFAILRCAEALRAYAADHRGRLPARLTDVTEVPVPTDPVSGMPFVYEAHGDRAKLSTPLRVGEKPEPYFHFVYELTLVR